MAVAKALAPPPVAAEWCLALVRPGGAAILWVGPSAEVAAVARVAGRLGGGLAEEHDGLLVLPQGRARLRPASRAAPGSQGSVRSPE